jgi:hypothetical protein
MMNSKIKIMVIGAAATFLCVACSKSDEPAVETAASEVGDEAHLVELLFVQHAQKVSLENSVLTLEGVGHDVLYFSDRPDRIVGRESLEKFIDDWDEGEESFATIPPNAIVTIVRGGESFDLAVVLEDPTMVGDDSMTYRVEVLDGPDSGVGEDAAVFIDAFGINPGRPGKPGKPGKPGDPGELRDGVDPKISGKRGREGTRKFQGNKDKLDRIL